MEERPGRAEAGMSDPQRLADLVDAGILVLSHPGLLIIRVNSFVSALSGHAARELKGRPLASIIRGAMPHPGSSVETTLITSEGGKLPVRLSLSQPMNDGNLLGTMVNSTQSADEASRSFREKQDWTGFIDGVVHCVPGAVATVDRKGRVVEWNAGAEKLFDWTADQARGRFLDTLLGVDDSEEDAASIIRVVSGERITDLECTLYSKSRAEIRVRMCATPIGSGSGIEGAVAVFTRSGEGEDPGNRRTYSDELFRTFADATQDAIIAMDHRGSITFFSPAAQSMFGYREDEVLGKDLHQLLAPEPCQEMFRAGFESFGKTGQGIVMNRILEMEARRRDGSGFPVELSAGAFKVEGRWHSVGMLRDITHRKIMETELVEAGESALNAERVKGEFLSGIGVEIGTPLKAIIESARLLSSTDLSPEQAGYAAICRNSGEGLLNTLEGMLDPAPGGQGGSERGSAPLSLPDLVERTCDSLSVKARAKGIGFSCMVHPDTPVWVLGDPGGIARILGILAGNAVRFTEQGEVGVKVEPVGGELIQFSVSDTGIGMPALRLQSMLQGFVKVNRLLPVVPGALGQGLTLCKRLVDSLGGSISATSEERFGSTFSVRLPLPQAFPEEAPQGGVISGFNGIRVLAVDDNRAELGILERAFSDWGASCETSESSDGARKLIAGKLETGEGYDLVVIDHNLQGLAGLDLLSALRREKLFSGPAILLLASDPGAETTAIMGELGAVGQVKPVTAAALHEAVASALESGRGAGTDGDRAHGVLNRSLRVLLVDGSPHERYLLMRYLGALPWELVQAGDCPTAFNEFERSRFDLVIINLGMPGTESFEIASAMRKAEREWGSRRVPMIALTETHSEPTKGSGNNACFDRILEKPIGKESLFRAITDILDDPSVESGRELTEVLKEPVPVELEPLLPEYLEKRRIEIGRMEDLLSEGAFEQVQKLAQEVNETGAAFGLEGVSRIARGIEAAAAGRDEAEIRNCLAALQEFIGTVSIDQQ